MLKNSRPRAPRVDHAFAPAERDVERRARIEGNASSRASPLPEPLGMIASDASVNASADATSLTVPSPPQAIHQRHAATERGQASSRAWPPRSVTKTSPSTPCAARSAAAQLGTLTRHIRPATRAGNRVDDDGDACCAHVASLHASTFGGTNQIERSGAPRREALDVDAADAALPERQRAPAPIRCAASSPRSGSWPTRAMRRRCAALASCAITAPACARARARRASSPSACRRRPRPAGRRSASRGRAGW